MRNHAGPMSYADACAAGVPCYRYLPGQPLLHGLRVYHFTVTVNALSTGQYWGPMDRHRIDHACLRVHVNDVAVACRSGVTACLPYGNTQCMCRDGTRLRVAVVYLSIWCVCVHVVSGPYPYGITDARYAYGT